MEDATDGDLTQLRTLVSTLGLARDAPITRLSSVSNIVCRIGDGADAVVVRAANRQRHGADRREEARNATNAAGVGLAPAVLHAGIDDGTFVTRWIDGRALDPVSVRGDHGAIGAVAAALRRVHALPPGRHRFDPVEVVDAHLADLDPRHDLHRARAVRDGAASRIEPAELVVCHNDPWPGNVIIVEDGARLVDWEYSGMNDPAWDLADFAVESDLDREDEDVLLHSYTGSAMVDAWRARVGSWKPVVDLLWSLWCIVELEAGNPADDFEAEGERRLRRAELALAQRPLDVRTRARIALNKGQAAVGFGEKLR